MFDERSFDTRSFDTRSWFMILAGYLRAMRVTIRTGIDAALARTAVLRATTRRRVND